MSFLDLLKKSQHARKIFGKAEITIVEKQLRGIALTQSEKNRLSRDIRQKLQFIRNAAEYLDDFDLKKGAESKKLVEETRKRLLEDVLAPHINKIVLFGSFPEKKMTFRSDIDIAVVFDSIQPRDAAQFRKRVLADCPTIIDLQVYNALPEKIQKEIDAKGKIIWMKE